MKSWKELIAPRDDVVAQKFNEAMFTAALDDVVTGREKSSIYADPATFFDNTHITSGLSQLIKQVFFSLKGKKEGNNVIELRTTFGGGKTHSLICLYHISRGIKLFSMHKNLIEIGKTLALPADFKVRIATLVGSRENVSKRKKIAVEGKKIEINTWWGDMAYQLGDASGFRIVEANDHDKSAPGKDTLHELFESIPDACLILMDEIVQYLVSVGGIDQHLYDETVQFLEQLIEYVGKRDKIALVFSLPESPLECINKAGQDAQQILDKAARKLQEQRGEEAFALTKKVSQRIKTIINPVEYIEIFEILRKRLFKQDESLDVEGIRLNLKELWDKYNSWGKKFLPDDIFKSSGVDVPWEQKLQKAFPFHPSLIDIFYNEWGAHAQFQRTRAILRIFAKILHRLWKTTESYGIIMPGEIPIEEDEDIRGELLTYMGPHFENVIATDIKRSKNLEQKYSGDYLKWNVYSRLFRSTFLHSLPVGGRSAGATERELILNSVLPDMMPVTFKDALVDLRDNLFHFFQKGGQYVIQFEVNLNAMIVDEMERISGDEVDTYLSKKMRELCPSSHPVVIWPEESKDIPEKPPKSTKMDLLYVVCPPTLLTTKMTIEKGTNATLQEWVTMRGSTPRINKNGTFFLVMNKGLVDELQRNTLRYLAMIAIFKEVEKGTSQIQLSEEQIAELIRGIYELEPDNSLKGKFKKYNSKDTLPAITEGKLKTQLRDAYSHIIHWTGKTLEQYELKTDTDVLASRALSTLINAGIVMEKMAPGYVSQLVKTTISMENFWNSFFQVSGETLPKDDTSLQESLAKSIEGKNLGYAVSQKGAPDASVNKPEEFPTWCFGIKIDPSEIKISPYSWLIPQTDAEKIVTNGETPPETPELADIPELPPYVNSITIAWNSVLKAEKYQLFRTTSPIQDIKGLKPLYTGTGIQYHETLTAPGTYYYAVLASNVHGDSHLSKVKHVTYRTDYPPTAPKLHRIANGPIENPKILLQWDESTGAEQYNLYVSSDLISTPEGLTPQYTGSEPSYKFELKDYGTYYVAVSAINQYGASPLSNYEGVTYGNISPPIAPLLHAQVTDDEKRVILSWNEVVNAQKYHLYKATNVFRTKPPSGSEIFVGKEITYEDDPKQVGTYYYAVTAENVNGESVPSNCESVVIGGAPTPVLLKMNLKAEYPDAFEETLGEFISDLVRIGADPAISISIKAQIPSSVPKIAQKTLKKKLDDALTKSSTITKDDIHWEV